MIHVRLSGDHLYGKLLLTWLSLVMSMMVYFCAVLFPNRCLRWDLDLNWVNFWGFSYPLFLTFYFHFDIMFFIIINLISIVLNFYFLTLLLFYCFFYSIYWLYFLFCLVGEIFCYVINLELWNNLKRKTYCYLSYKTFKVPNIDPKDFS